MIITMQIMADFLSSLGTPSKYGHFRKTPLSRPVLWDRHILPVPGKIYVADTAALPEMPEMPADCLLICTGVPPGQPYLIGKIPMIYLPDIELPALLNHVLDIYCGLTDWSHALQEIVFQDGSIDRLLQCSIPVFENPISVTDVKMNSIARYSPNSVPGSEDGPFAAALHDGPLAPVDATAVRKRIQKLGYDRVPRLCRDYGGHVYNVDLLLGNLHLGQVSIIDTNRPFRPGDSQLLEELAIWVTKAFQQRSAFLNSSTDSFRALMFDLLEGRSFSEKELCQRSFYPVGENGKAPALFCVAICLSEESERFSPGYIARLLEKEFPGLCAREYQGNTAALMSLPEEENDAQAFFSRLEALLRQLELHCGVSRNFQKLPSLRDHYQQAIAAQATGMRLNPSKSVYFFQDTVLPYMILHTTGGLSLEQICPRGLLKLRKSSRREYWDSLRAYLYNGYNASETARSLYLHRSTLLKHLNRAEQILGMKLEGADEMLYLQLCMRLIELNGE